MDDTSFSEISLPEEYEVRSQEGACRPRLTVLLANSIDDGLEAHSVDVTALHLALGVHDEHA